MWHWVVHLIMAIAIIWFACRYLVYKRHHDILKKAAALYEKILEGLQSDKENLEIYRGNMETFSISDDPFYFVGKVKWGLRLPFHFWADRCSNFQTTLDNVRSAHQARHDNAGPDPTFFEYSSE
jgi:hypothetical protein